jgi:hypothetical protein
VLSAVTFLGFFVDVVVRTSIEVDDELFQYLACFDLLRVMLAILQNGNLDDLGTLRTATQSHHELYMELYHRIPKLHNMAHVVDFWEHWRYLLSCFGPERHHRFFKRVMRFSYNSGNSTAVAYDVRAWMKSLDTEELYMPIHLLGKQKGSPGSCAVAWRGLSDVHSWCQRPEYRKGHLGHGRPHPVHQ